MVDIKTDNLLCTELTDIMTSSRQTGRPSMAIATPSDPDGDCGLRILSKGTFGAVYHHPGSSIVYRQVFDAFGDNNLFAEFTQWATA